MKTWLFVSVIVFMVFVVGAGVLIVVYDKTIYPLKFENEITASANEFDVEDYVIASIICAESRFNEKAISNKGAVGLMQILPSTGAWVAKQLSANGKVVGTFISTGDIQAEKQMYDAGTKQGELLNPETNIRIGTCYFAYLLNKFENFETAVCAYNAGEGTVKGWLVNKELSKDGKKLDKIPYKETSSYLSKVMRNVNVYRNKFVS